MAKPLLQVALDQTNIQKALEAAKILAPQVDVLEAGTILCYAEGIDSVAAIRSQFKTHILVADLKAADAGAVLAQLAFERGATWMTCICSAPIATMEAALKIAKKYQGDIQIELYGSWAWDDVAEWKKIGIRKLIYHRGRDAAFAGQGWAEADIQKIEKLTANGMSVSVTGGLNPEDIKLFADIPVDCFIAGRSLYEAKDPALSAKQFKDAIGKHYKS